MHLVWHLISFLFFFLFFRLPIAAAVRVHRVEEQTLWKKNFIKNKTLWWHVTKIDLKSLNSDCFFFNISNWLICYTSRSSPPSKRRPKRPNINEFEQSTTFVVVVVVVVIEVLIQNVVDTGAKWANCWDNWSKTRLWIDWISTVNRFCCCCCCCCCWSIYSKYRCRRWSKWLKTDFKLVKNSIINWLNLNSQPLLLLLLLLLLLKYWFKISLQTLEPMTLHCWLKMGFKITETIGQKLDSKWPIISSKWLWINHRNWKLVSFYFVCLNWFECHWSAVAVQVEVEVGFSRYQYDLYC